MKFYYASISCYKRDTNYNKRVVHIEQFTSTLCSLLICATRHTTAQHIKRSKSTSYFAKNYQVKNMLRYNQFATGTAFLFLVVSPRGNATYAGPGQPLFTSCCGTKKKCNERNGFSSAVHQCQNAIYWIRKYDVQCVSGRKKSTYTTLLLSLLS